jgi:hypothetical protein
VLRLEVSTFGRVLEHVVFISQQQLGQVNTVRKHSQAPQNGINKSEPATRVRSPNHTTLREILNLDHGRLLREVGRLAKKNWTWFAKQIKCFLQKSPRPFVRSSWFMIQWRHGVGFWCLQYLAVVFPRILLSLRTLLSGVVGRQYRRSSPRFGCLRHLCQSWESPWLKLG